ncbi:MAG: hypothetical protein ACI4NU_10495 [Christensenellales bacterium]
MLLLPLIESYRSLSIIGMCKNAGKTTVLNRMIEEMQATGKTLGLTSIGRDGESVDVVTRTHKPGIYVREGTLIATAFEMLKYCDISREIVETTGFPTPLGEVVIVRARSDGNVQLAGPSITAQLAKLSGMFFSLGADVAIVDGALSRKTLCAPAVSEATVLCTGASYSRDINTVIDDTAFATMLLTLPEQTDFTEEERAACTGKALLRMEDGSLRPLPQELTLADALRSPAYAGVRAVYVAGAVTDALLKPVLMAGKRFDGLSLSAEDGSKLLIRRDTFDKLALRGISLAVARATRVAAITVNPFSAYGFDLDKDELRGRMQERVNVPVLNVLEDVRLEDMAWRAEDKARIAAREEEEKNADHSHCCGNEEIQ